MIDTQTRPPGVFVALPAASQRQAFLAVLRRDLYVTRSEIGTFLAQVVLSPLFLLLVFGKILGSLGYTQNGYSDLLFPGLLALTAVMTGLQTDAFPLVFAFAITMELEDRLLAPISTNLLALERILVSGLRAMVAAALTIPIGILVLGSIPWRWSGLPMLILAAIFGSLLGGAIGLVIGTLVTPRKITIVFALVFTPLLFTGCSQYPWPSLAGLRWFQVIAAANPMTYVSEAMRGAIVPSVPHIAPWICVLAMITSLALLTSVGLWGFKRRAIN